MKKISKNLAKKIERGGDYYVTRDYIYTARLDRLAAVTVYERIRRNAVGTTASLHPERVEVAE